MVFLEEKYFPRGKLSHFPLTFHPLFSPFPRVFRFNFFDKCENEIKIMFETVITKFILVTKALPFP